MTTKKGKRKLKLVAEGLHAMLAHVYLDEFDISPIVQSIEIKVEAGKEIDITVNLVPDEVLIELDEVYLKIKDGEALL